MLRLFTYFLFLLVSTSAHSIIIGGSVTDIGSIGVNDAFDQGGVFTELSLPFSIANTVGNDTFQTANLYAFNEGQNITLNSNYSVNIGSALTSGMVISSHYVFFDPDNSTYQEGWVDFDADILAVITNTSLLLASDDFLNNNVTYLNPAARGLESVDSVRIGTAPAELDRLYVDWRASTPGDYVRVITGYSVGGENPCTNNPPGVGGCPANVPEPSIFALFGVGLVGLGFSARRRRRF